MTTHDIDSCVGARYVVSSEHDDNCSRATSVHQLGEEVPAGSVFYLDPSTRACAMAAAPDPSTTVHALYHRYGDEVSMSSFVTAHEAPSDDDGHRIVPLDLVADDGARQRLLGWSTETRMPYDVSYDFSLRSSGWGPARAPDGSCSPPAPSSSVPYSVVERGSGRLHPLYTATQEGLPIAPYPLPGRAPRFTDTARHEECELTTFASGLTACIPAPQTTLERGVAAFTDAACQVPVVHYRSRDLRAPLPLSVYLRDDTNEVCDPRPVVLAVGAAVCPPPATLFVLSVGSGTCSPATDELTLLPGDEIYALGDVVPMTAFAVATRSQE